MAEFSREDKGRCCSSRQPQGLWETRTFQKSANRIKMPPKVTPYKNPGNETAGRRAGEKSQPKAFPPKTIMRIVRQLKHEDDRKGANELYPIVDIHTPRSSNAAKTVEFAGPKLTAPNKVWRCGYNGDTNGGTVKLKQGARTTKAHDAASQPLSPI